MTELQSLQNAADDLHLTIHEMRKDDKRKTVERFYVTYDDRIISPILDYENINHFLLGWRKCAKIHALKYRDAI